MMGPFLPGWITLFVLPSFLHHPNGLDRLCEQARGGTCHFVVGNNQQLLVGGHCQPAGDGRFKRTLQEVRRVRRAFFGSPVDVEDQRISGDEANVDWLASRFRLPNTWKTTLEAARLNSCESVVLCNRIDWYQSRFLLSDKEMSMIIRRCPQLLTLSTKNNVLPTIRFLQDRLQLCDSDVSKMLKRSPSILTRGIGEGQSLQQSIDWLHDSLQIKGSKQLGKLLTRAPRVLQTSMDRKLVPRMESMQEHLGLDRNETALVFRRCPALFTRSFSRSIRPNMDWLRHRFSLDADELRRFVKLHPPLLTCNIQETLEPKLEWIHHRLGGISENTLKHLVRRAPRLLSLTTDNLEPKLEFLQFQLGVALTTEAIIKCPILLECSLEARLKPRVAEAQQNGLTLDAACLKRIAQYTDDMWAGSVAFQVKKKEREDGF